MVISRPSGTADVGYRMVARPLLDRLEAVRGQVELVVLRPPTRRAAPETGPGLGPLARSPRASKTRCLSGYGPKQRMSSVVSNRCTICHKFLSMSAPVRPIKIASHAGGRLKRDAAVTGQANRHPCGSVLAGYRDAARPQTPAPYKGTRSHDPFADYGRPAGSRPRSRRRPPVPAATMRQFKGPLLSAWPCYCE